MNLHKAIALEKLSKFRNKVVRWAKEFFDVNSSKIEIDGLDAFRDGLAFLYFIHYYDESLIDVEAFDTSDSYRVLESAFSLAEEYLDIPNILCPQDVISSTNEQSLVLYIYLYKIKFDLKSAGSGDREFESSHRMADLKQILSKKVESVRSLMDLLTHEQQRLISLLRQDELYKEKIHYEKHLASMNRKVEKNIEICSELQKQNDALKQQNSLLLKNIDILQKKLSQEVRKKKEAKKLSVTKESVKSFLELLMSENLSGYLNKYEKGVFGLTDTQS
ncbi:cortexillin-1-like [Schistocerca gregaria]|uniref:cortexillin-1-like n=1 Tax=Schistocerca gregaria TaxID=7010 RepID=UPI00211E780D|nr:cortexillin-1-like [Schistocerca gregaria]